MNFPLIFPGMGILCIAVLVATGCMGTGPSNSSGQVPDPAETPVPEGHIVAIESQNGTTVYVNQNATITLKLKENPTTGYQWNMTVSPGLVITSDSIVSSDTTGKLMGAGGTRTWEMNADNTGTQTIHAVYRRSWEPVSGNETAFSMTVIVQ